MKRWWVFACFAFVLVLDWGRPVAAGNLVKNGDFNQAGQTPSSAAFWSPVGDGYARIIDPANAGNAQAQLAHCWRSKSFAGAYQTVLLRQTEARPVRVTARVSGWSVEDLGKGESFGASLFAYIRLRDGTKAYSENTFRTKSVGNFNWREIGFNSAARGIEKPIESIEVQIRLGTGRGVACFDAVKIEEIETAGGRGAVSLVFDDCYASVGEIVAPALENRKMIGNLAAVTSYLGTAGYLSWEEAKKLSVGKGWSMLSHGVTHRSLPALLDGEAEDELYDSRAALAKQGITAWHFALPFGDYNSRVAELGRRYYLSVRTVERGDNPYGLFPSALRIQEVNNNTTAAEISGWLAHAREHKRWLILVFHDINSTASNGYNVTPARFAAALDQIAASGLPVVSYDQGFKDYGVGWLSR